MRPGNIKSKYTDNLARQKRAHFLFKIGLVFILVAIAIGGILYLLFFYKFMDVRAVTIEGLKTINSEELRDKIMERLEEKYLGYIPRKDYLLFLDTDDLRSEILSQYPTLKSVEIEKNMPHELIFKLNEREALGIWCLRDNNCQYFDSDKNTWGPAGKSSGFLIMTVEDKRKNEKIDDEYFNSIKLLIDKDKKLPVTIKDIIIPEDSFRDFRVNTSDEYYLLLSLDSDIPQQIEVLKIFLGEGQLFNEYIDLRIDGRVYYR